MLVLKIRGVRSSLLFLAQERSRGLPIREGFRDRATTIRAKAWVDHPKVGDISGRLARQCREHVSITTSLDTSDGISLRGRDPRVMGHPSPSHQWDIHRLSLLLLTPPWAKGTNISPKELHRPLPLHDQARKSGHGSRSRTRLTSWDLRDLRERLRHHTSD